MSTLDSEKGRFDLLARPVNRDATLRHYGALLDLNDTTYSVQLWPRGIERKIFPHIVSSVERAGANPNMTMGVTIGDIYDRKDSPSHYILGGREAEGRIVRIYPYSLFIAGKKFSRTPLIYSVPPTEIRHVATLAEIAFQVASTHDHVQP